jgi:toxin ParE1/3/4
MAEARRRVVWSAPALDELDEIAAYIAQDNPAAAARLIEACLAKVERLVTYPSSGRVVPELRGGRYREVLEAPCRLIYRVEGRTVVIVHAMRGERRLRRKNLR